MLILKTGFNNRKIRINNIMIQAIVNKNFRDIDNGKVYIKNSIYVSNDLERCECLEKNSYISITQKSDGFLTLNELKNKYKSIKAKSKKDFLNKLNQL